MSDVEKKDLIERKPMTFWLPGEYKAKYDQIQQDSRGKFGKILKRVLMKAIDRVIDDEKAG